MACLIMVQALLHQVWGSAAPADLGLLRLPSFREPVCGAAAPAGGAAAGAPDAAVASLSGAAGRPLWRRLPTPAETGASAAELPGCSAVCSG